MNFEELKKNDANATDSLVVQAMHDIASEFSTVCIKDEALSKDGLAMLVEINGMQVNLSCNSSSVVFTGDAGPVNGGRDALRSVLEANHDTSKAILGSACVINERLIVISAINIGNESNYSIVVSKIKLYIMNFVASIRFWNQKIDNFGAQEVSQMRK